jgi:hypothetical protein
MASAVLTRAKAIVADASIFVLLHGHGTARLPFLAAWIHRHRLTSGFAQAHASAYPRVIVIGQPDGLDLPKAARVAYVNAETADARFALDPDPESFFGGAA